MRRVTRKSLWLAASVGLFIALAIDGMVPTAHGAVVGPGAPNYGSINGMLSDFQQSYGQVVGNEFTLADGGRITSLTVYGLYYNYRNYVSSPPVADDFTLRLHGIVAGDPVEAFLFEQNIGAGVRTDTGNNLFGLQIYQYQFTGLDIAVASGTTLLSIIDNTVNPSTDGYWHWVSANDGPGDDWWRREDSQPVGQESTYYWTANASYMGDRAFTMTVVPEPATLVIWSLLAGLAAVGYWWRRQ